MDECEAMSGADDAIDAGDDLADLSAHQRRHSLPVLAHRRAILYALETSRVLTLIACTGSGKSTQTPQFLYHAGYCRDNRRIAIAQPRRLAAIRLAARVAQELDDSGNDSETVGYTVRFDSTVTDNTAIVYMTDGALLREMLVDPMLARYSVVMVDELHERSINTDILLGLLKLLLKKRKDLKLVLSSATLHYQPLKSFFDSEKVSAIRVDGKLFAIDIHYTKHAVKDYIQATVDTIDYIYHTQPISGDVLVFLTGRSDIDSVVRLLADRRYDNTSVLPLYGGLTLQSQLAVFRPSSKRKIIISTNIAETSVTIDGVVYVIDCGYVKQRVYHPITGLSSLTVVPISRASAKQRAGRAGRTQPGVCFRLYTEQYYNDSMIDNDRPEIQRWSLASLTLTLLSMGVTNILRFPFLSQPPSQLLVSALTDLYSVGAIDRQGRLTMTGELLIKLPCELFLARALIASLAFHDIDTVTAVCSIIAMTEALNNSSRSSIFVLPSNVSIVKKSAIVRQHLSFTVCEGDHLTLLNVYRSYCQQSASRKRQWCQRYYVDYHVLELASQIQSQLAGIVRQVLSAHSQASDNVSSDGLDSLSDRVRYSLSCGLFARCARRIDSEQWRDLRSSETLTLDYDSALNASQPPSQPAGAEYVIYQVCEQSAGSERRVMRLVTSIDSAWLLRIAPHYFSFATGHSKSLARLTEDHGGAAVPSGIKHRKLF